MLISASYRTDIPAFYGEWFMSRIRAGYCLVQHPYNKSIQRIDLTPEHVDGIVFWTKNMGPLLPHLGELKDRGYCMMVQYTITNYPHEIERSVAPASRQIEHVQRIVEVLGPDSVVWRYDPIISTNLTRANWHIDNFIELADRLQGLTNEVVISFVQGYEKTKRNISPTLEWTPSEQVPLERKQELVRTLAAIASSYGMQLSVCTQPELIVEGVKEARCVDADRLERIAQHSLGEAKKLGGMREGCGCYANTDIGAYETCPHGCVYCYAVKSREQALNTYKAHDPESEFLVAPQMISVK